MVRRSEKRREKEANRNGKIVLVELGKVARRARRVFAARYQKFTPTFNRARRTDQDIDLIFT